MALTREKLRQLIRYDAETGQFFRRLKPSRRHPAHREVPCGRIDDKGYVIIFVDGHHHKAHRLAWLWMTGAFPPDQIDHIDRDKANNRWRNLRPASNSQNQANTPARKHNRSGLKGIYEQHGRWTARIGINRNRLYLGSYQTAQEAHEVYTKMANKIHGEFARLS